jgi:phytoene synthase
MNAPLVVRDGSIAADSRAVLARHARSFRLGALFLPPAATDDAAVVYAFCREADDAVDEAPSPAAAAAALSAFDAELRGLSPARPIIRAFLAVAARRAIPLFAARDLLAGMRDDLGTVRLPDDAALYAYCYRAAGAVGLMMNGVLGVTAPVAAAPAVDLGIAMQITNICRDVAEDAARGRVYLPADRLEAVGLTPEVLLRGGLSPGQRGALARVVADLLAAAEEHYAAAWAGMGFIPARARLAILVAGTLYRDIGRRLRDVHGSDPTHGRTQVPGWARARGIAAAIVDFVRPHTWRAAARPPSPRRLGPPWGDPGFPATAG